MNPKKILLARLLLAILLCAGRQRQCFSADILYVANNTLGVSGFIGEYTNTGATINTHLITGMKWPDAVVPASGLLYTVDAMANEVGQYTTSGMAVNASLVPLHLPVDIAADGNGHLFVAYSNNVNSFVGEYATSGAPINPTLISLGSVAAVSYIVGLALDPQGDLFVSVSGMSGGAKNGFISEYKSDGTLVHASLISNLDYPSYIALDSHGDLFVSEASDFGGYVGAYTTSGTTINAQLITGLNGAAGVATDESGDLFVANNQSGIISEYTTSGGVVNASLITGLQHPAQITIQTVPEPSSFALLTIGAIGLVALARRRAGR